MTYFHSAYRRPLHMDAMMADETFPGYNAGVVLFNDGDEWGNSFIAYKNWYEESGQSPTPSTLVNWQEENYFDRW